MNNTLHARTSGQGPDVILLHGLFGQGSNLGSVSRALMHPIFAFIASICPIMGVRPGWPRRRCPPMRKQCVTGWINTSYQRRTLSATHWAARWRWNWR